MFPELFTHAELHRARSARAENFSLEDDMSQVERSFLADLLVDDLRENEYWRLDLIKRINRIERFRNCGREGQRFVCPSCQIQFFSRFYCKAKLCDVCARIYGRQIYRKVMDLIRPCLSNKKAGWTVAMLTLSESSARYRGHYPTADQYKRFNRNVGAFCRLFYGKFRGVFTKAGKVREDRRHYQGAGTIGVNEFGNDNNNLHCHILLYGPWIPWEKLQRAWVKITGGDTGCFIEPIRNPDKAATYVAKYITKPPRFYEAERAVEFLKSTKGARRIRTGGIFYNQVSIKRSAKEADHCPFCSVGLSFQGTCKLTEAAAGLNLHHVRKNPTLYETDELREIVGFLPGGVMPISLSKFPRLTEDRSVA